MNRKTLFFLLSSVCITLLFFSACSSEKKTSSNEASETNHSIYSEKISENISLETQYDVNSLIGYWISEDSELIVQREQEEFTFTFSDENQMEKIEAPVLLTSNNSNSFIFTFSSDGNEFEQSITIIFLENNRSIEVQRAVNDPAATGTGAAKPIKYSRRS